MNQRQAGNVLRKNAPRGEHPAFINPQEASWLRGMGGSGKKTKSGLRSYEVPSMMDREKQTRTAADSDRQRAATDTMTNASNFMGQDFGAKYGSDVPGVPAPLPTPNNDSGGGNSLPNVGGSGYNTRTPTGPGSVTNPNDPYGVQEAVATGAKGLIDKEYEAPTLTPEQRIAATSQQTLDARQGVQDMQGTGQAAYGQAAGVGANVSGYDSAAVGPQSFLSGKSVDQYANPHTANVIQNNTNSAMDAMDIRRNQLSAKAEMSGAGTNDRAALERGVMQSEALKNLSSQTAALYGQGFDKASAMKKYDMDSATNAGQFNVNAGQRDQDINLRGANTQMAATNASRNASAADINMLSGVGADVEGREQNVLDGTMDDFYEERDWGENKLASAANIAGTNPTGSTTSTTGPEQYQKKDKFGRVISGAAAGWLATGGNPWGAAVGGGAALLS